MFGKKHITRMGSSEAKIWVVYWKPWALQKDSLIHCNSNALDCKAWMLSEIWSYSRSCHVNFFPCKEAIWNASARVGILSLKFPGCSTSFEKPVFKYPNSLVYETRNLTPQEEENLHWVIRYSSVQFYLGKKGEKKESKKDKEREAWKLMNKEKENVTYLFLLYEIFY